MSTPSREGLGGVPWLPNAAVVGEALLGGRCMPGCGKGDGGPYWFEPGPGPGLEVVVNPSYKSSLSIVIESERSSLLSSSSLPPR